MNISATVTCLSGYISCQNEQYIFSDQKHDIQEYYKYYIQTPDVRQ